MRAALAAIGELVDEVLAADPDAMGDAELTGAVVDLMGLRDRMAAASARLVAPWADRGCWAEDGSGPPGCALPGRPAARGPPRSGRSHGPRR